MPIIVGVLAETALGERRVALDPDSTSRLVQSGARVLVENDAGLTAAFPNAEYERAGAAVVDRDEVLATCSVLAAVRMPDEATTRALRAGQVLIGLLDPLDNLGTLGSLAADGVTTVAFEFLPRTISRAQAMDALSSQASASGYRAAILAASTFARYLPMMITASGTAKPASVLVIGTGVAGLQAIATARRLGAVVTGYDVRAASRGEVESLGARFLTSSIATGSGEGGYARAMTAEEHELQRAELADAVAGFDIVIATAKVPGQAPPELVSSETLARMRAGSVCVDLAAGPRGGNIAGSVDGESVITPGGVTVVGAGDLASDLAASSSQMYGRNVAAVIAALTSNGEIVIDRSDEIQRSIVVTWAGEVVNVAVRGALGLDPDAPSTSVTSSEGVPAS